MSVILDEIRKHHPYNTASELAWFIEQKLFKTEEGNKYLVEKGYISKEFLEKVGGYIGFNLDTLDMYLREETGKGIGEE